MLDHSDPALRCCFILALVCSGTSAGFAENSLTVVGGTGAAGTNVSVVVELTNDFPVLGWSYGVCIPSADLAVVNAALSPQMLALSPEFLEIELPPEGVACALVISYDPLQTIAPQSSMQILDITVTLLGAPGTSTTVALCEGIGAPPVAVVIAGPAPPQEVAPVVIAGTVTVGSPGSVPHFVRSDCNGDGSVNIADAISILSSLFVTGEIPPCTSACDTNDDGSMNIADAIRALGALFLGEIIPAPNSCGEDPTTDGLACPLTICP